MAGMPRLLVLYGSQTGNSKDVADRVAREARRRHFRPAVLAMDAYPVERLPQEGLAVFVAATTGQGEPPGNMAAFWRFLRRASLPADLLAGMRAAVFGLGDSGYVGYNVVAKKLSRRLEQLGCAELLPRGLGDDQHPAGYEAALDPWLADLWTTLRRLHPLPPGLADPEEGGVAALEPPRYTVTLLPPLQSGAAPSTAADGAAAAGAPGHAQAGQAAGALREQIEAVEAASQFDRLEDAAAGAAADASGQQQLEWGPGTGPGRPCLATLLSNERQTAAEHWQDTRHMRFSLGEHGPSYEPGDVLSIFPQQAEEAVAAVLQLLGLRPEQRLRLALAEPPGGGQAACMEASAGAFLRGCLDVGSASPRRRFFEVLAHFAAEPLQRERLQHFGSAEGRDDCALYCQREGRTVLEVLRDFPSAALPLAWLAQLCPRLRPRQFSAATAQAAHPREAAALVAVVDWRTPFRRRKRGLCSGWLAGLAPGARVPLWVGPGVLRLPPDPAAPLVMVGPGTGVAPFRAFCEAREAAAAAGAAQAPGFLFFGCRSASRDFYYEELWQRLRAEGILDPDAGLVTAFSRDQPQKVYVTHRLAEHAPLLWRLLQQGAHVFVSGSAERMPQEVAAVFTERVLQREGGLEPAAARRAMRQLEACGRYVVEAWS